MRALRTGFAVLLPVLVVMGLWLVAEDRQQNAVYEREMRRVPRHSVLLRRPPEPFPAGDTLVDRTARALDPLLPATL